MIICGVAVPVHGHWLDKFVHRKRSSRRQVRLAALDKQLALRSVQPLGTHLAVSEHLAVVMRPGFRKFQAD